MTPSAQNSVPTGVLLLYTGSPQSPESADVAAYLREFLMDPCVMEIPRPVRTILVKGIIAPLRAGRSARKYEQIWMPEGSPLTVFTHRFQNALTKLLPEFPMAAGAAYGQNSIAAALKILLQKRVQRIVAFPLFPHYADATRGSLSVLLHSALQTFNAENIEIREVSPFYAHCAYIEAMRTTAMPLLNRFEPDKIVFSYHGLPLRQARRTPENGDGKNYEEQCLESTRLLADTLNLKDADYRHAYQSRFGRGWLAPELKDVLLQCGQSGSKKVAVIAPSFVADCLETLEELDVEARIAFLSAGGCDYLRVPALNDEESWIRAAANLVRQAIE